MSLVAAAGAAAMLVTGQAEGDAPEGPAGAAEAGAALLGPSPAFPDLRPMEAPAPDAGPLVTLADLAPYFGEGPLAEAKAAFDRGAYGKCQELLAGAEPTPPVRYLQAVAALRGQDFAQAAPALEALAVDYPAMADRCLVNAGWAYERVRDFVAAARAFGGVPSWSRLAIDAAIGLSRALRAQRDFKGARAALAPYVDRAPPAWGRNLGAEALVALADLAQAQGDAKAEREALLLAWARHPAAPVHAKVEARLGPVEAPPLDLLLTRAEALVEVHQNAQGLALVEPLLSTLKLPQPQACRAHFVAGKAHRKLRAHAKAVAALAPVVARCGDPELLPKAMYVLGFSQGIVAPAAAAATYRALAARFPSHAYADDALFFAAEVHQRQGELAEAQAQLVALVDSPAPSDFTGDALFKLFTLALEAERFEEALVYLEELDGRFASADDPFEVDRARYWFGRWLERQGHGDDAVAVWQTLALTHPVTYYGLLSRERVEAADPRRGRELGEAIAAHPEAAPAFPLHAGALHQEPHYLAAVELLRLGFTEQVTSEVIAVDRKAQQPEALRLLVHVLALAGETRAAHGMARLWLKGELSGPITAQTRALWEIAYPEAYRDLVVEHTEAADGLDPDLLQALMREESALDPNVKSWAGAIGLCQLMPGTAAGVALSLKLRPPSHGELVDPALNIKLGARYLADLVARFDGVTQYALASYNAGEGAVARWRRANPGAALDAWVEAIPLQETRGYVKRVLRSYNTYKLLYAPTQLARTQLPKPAPPKKGKPQASRPLSRG